MNNAIQTQKQPSSPQPRLNCHLRTISRLFSVFALPTSHQKTPNRKINFLLYFLHHHQRMKINYISSLFHRDQFKRHLFLIYQHLIPFIALISFTHKDCGIRVCFAGVKGFSTPCLLCSAHRTEQKSFIVKEI